MTTREKSVLISSLSKAKKFMADELWKIYQQTFEESEDGGLRSNPEKHKIYLRANDEISKNIAMIEHIICLFR